MVPIFRAGSPEAAEGDGLDGGTSLAASVLMDEALSLNLNGKLKLRLRLVRSAVVAARAGWADRLAAGQFLKIVDPHGKQVGDFWAVTGADLDEHLSAMHTRVWVNRLCPWPGESFHTNHRRPILQLVHDTCGVHDLLTAPCDEHRYRLYGVQGEHASCTTNFGRVMEPYLGSAACFVPQPVNLFMNVGVFPDGRVESGGNPSKPGDSVVFKAWIDSIVALSAYPQGFNPVAGWYPTDLHVGIYEAA
jgi:uncharacterized protein YcgI (DUF1989 family)